MRDELSASDVRQMLVRACWTLRELSNDRNRAESVRRTYREMMPFVAQLARQPRFCSEVAGLGPPPEVAQDLRPALVVPLQEVSQFAEKPEVVALCGNFTLPPPANFWTQLIAAMCLRIGDPVLSLDWSDSTSTRRPQVQFTFAPPPSGDMRPQWLVRVEFPDDMNEREYQFREYLQPAFKELFQRLKRANSPLLQEWKQGWETIPRADRVGTKPTWSAEVRVEVGTPVLGTDRWRVLSAACQVDLGDAPVRTFEETVKPVLKKLLAQLVPLEAEGGRPPDTRGLAQIWASHIFGDAPHPRDTGDDDSANYARQWRRLFQGQQCSCCVKG